jgi:hypothetical protein
MTAVIVDGVAHALEIAVEHARQNCRLESIAHRGRVDKIGKKYRDHLALGGGCDARAHAIADEMLQHAGGGQPRTGFLQVLKVVGGRFQLNFQGRASAPLAIEQHGEERHDQEQA